MNPDEAYRLQTDWARAVRAQGSNHAEWWDRCAARMMATPGGDPGGAHFRRFGEPETLEVMRRNGPIVDSSTIVGYEPAGTPDDPLPTDVYDDDSGALVDQGELDKLPSQILVPAELHRQVTLDALAAAPTYYVTPDMVTVIEAAAAAFDSTDMMPRLPRRSGFVVLARPIEIPMGDSVEHVRAFAWNLWSEIKTGAAASGRGVTGEVWTFSSRRRDAGFRPVEEARKIWSSKTAWRDEPELLPSFCDWLLTGAPVPPISEPGGLADARFRALTWFYDQMRPHAAAAGGVPQRPVWDRLLTAAEARYDQFLAEETAKGSTGRYGFFQPYLAAFVLLLTQQITTAQEQPASPTSVRLASKVSRNRSSKVTVVDIRHVRRTGSDREPTGATRGPLTSRQLVGSHWKWQPYGEGRALRRRIFVSGYVRGPEDAPLVVKPRVTRLS